MNWYWNTFPPDCTGIQSIQSADGETPEHQDENGKQLFTEINNDCLVVTNHTHCSPFVTVDIFRRTENQLHNCGSGVRDRERAEQSWVYLQLPRMHLFYVSGWTTCSRARQCANIHCYQLGGGLNSDMYGHGWQRTTHCLNRKETAGVRQVTVDFIYLIFLNFWTKDIKFLMKVTLWIPQKLSPPLLSRTRQYVHHWPWFDEPSSEQHIQLPRPLSSILCLCLEDG